MSFQFWDSEALSTMFNSNTQGGSFPANVSAYFRRPTKIIKTGSRNNSPRSNGRRRMTTTGHFPTRTRSVVDHQRSAITQYTQHQHQPSARPISWHPNMMEDVNHVQMSYQPMIDNYMATPYTTTEVNGLITPLSYPIMDEPQIQELITPLEGLSAHDPNVQYRDEQDFSNSEYWMSQQHVKDIQYDFESGCIYSDANYQSWYANNQYQMHNVPTAPASPNYIPMPDFGAPLTLLALQPEIEKEELVGMGLYDSPAQVQTSALLLSGDIGSVKRKSLKLEDAFEPSPSSDDEDDEEDEEYAEDDDDVLKSNHVNSGVIDDMSSATNLSVEHAHIMNGYPLMTNQWSVDGRNSYGWV